MNPEYINIPFEIIDANLPTFTDIVNPHKPLAIAAVNIKTGKRYLIKVSSLATREKLSGEVDRMNFNSKEFRYAITNEGASI